MSSGRLGVAIFGLAMYGGLAFLLEAVQKRQVPPVFRRGASRESFEGDLNAQLADLADEAGVRKTSRRREPGASSRRGGGSEAPDSWWRVAAAPAMIDPADEMGLRLTTSAGGA